MYSIATAIALVYLLASVVDSDSKASLLYCRVTALSAAALATVTALALTIYLVTAAAYSSTCSITAKASRAAPKLASLAASKGTKEA